MIGILAKKLVFWQIKKNYLFEKDCILYIYAYELFIGQALNVLISCILAVLFHVEISISIFLISFFALRSYAGGHHADTYSSCTIISSLIVLAACIASKVIPKDSILAVNLIAGFICGGLILKLAPAEDHNKPLSDMEKKRYRKNSILIWGCENIFWMVSYSFGAKDISLAVALGFLAASGLLCAGVVKNKYLSGM